jgi:hypothetical protein
MYACDHETIEFAPHPFVPNNDCPDVFQVIELKNPLFFQNFASKKVQYSNYCVYGK